MVSGSARAACTVPGARSRCLTPRSSGEPTAWHLARGPLCFIIRPAGQAPHRQLPLSSNVRHRRAAVSVRPRSKCIRASRPPRICLQTVQVVGTAMPLGGVLRFQFPLNLAWFALGGSQRAGNTNALAPGWHCAGAQSLLLLRAAACAVASNPARHASASAAALTQGLPRSVAFGVQWQGIHRKLLQVTPVPNPSVKRRANGVALGPRAAVLHHPSRGPGTTPPSPAYLER